MNEITVVDIFPQLVLGMRKTGGYEEISNILPKLFEFALANNLTIVGPPIFVCHEMTVEEAEKAHREGSADVEVAIPILIRGDETEEIKAYELPGGKMAKIIHKGPYEECGPYYEKLFEWTRKNDKKIVGPTREVYLNDPREVPPEEILTEIYAPID
jgi:AraC family transcriptional regulator